MKKLAVAPRDASAGNYNQKVGRKMMVSTSLMLVKSCSVQFNAPSVELFIR